MEDKFNNNIDETLLLEDDRIVRYLKGKMTAEEEQEFMQELDSNDELKSKAIATARLVKGLKEAGADSDEDVINEFKEADKEDVMSIVRSKGCGNNVAANRTSFNHPDVAASVPASNHKSPWRKAATWLSAAASVALLVWGGYSFNNYRKTTGLGEEYSTVFSSSQFIRGGEDNAEIENKLAKLFDNVASKKDLDNTLHELSLCWEIAIQETYNDYTDYAPEIGWNLALGHLRNNDKKKAKVVLKKLIDVAPEGTAIGDKARELLKKVEEL